MEFGIKGKTAIVCGASQGLGRACAEGLAAEGVNLVICSRDFDRIFNTARTISEACGAEIVPMACDITQADAATKLIREAESKFGGVHILVNNAGGPPAGTFENTDDESWEEAFRLTLMSAVRLSRAVLPIMKNQHWGRIINLTSISVKQPIQGLLLSNSLRAAVVGMAKTLSQEAGPYNVLINNIATGSFDTDRLRSLFEKRARAESTTPDRILSAHESEIPLGRLGEPEELANLVVFLASEKASYITGATISVDGGAFAGLM